MAEQTSTLEVAVIRKAPTPVDLTDSRLVDLVGHCLSEERADGTWQIAIAFVDSVEIRMLHGQFMGDPTPTDILTFPYVDPEISGGDIAICIAVANQQAPEHGKSLSDELAFLVLHGILHLTGHNDGTDVDRATMLARQDEILKSWSIANR